MLLNAPFFDWMILRLYHKSNTFSVSLNLGPPTVCGSNLAVWRVTLNCSSVNYFQYIRFVGSNWLVQMFPWLGKSRIVPGRHYAAASKPKVQCWKRLHNWKCWRVLKADSCFPGPVALAKMGGACHPGESAVSWKLLNKEFHKCTLSLGQTHTIAKLYR